jgi:hypothetical protein
MRKFQYLDRAPAPHPVAADTSCCTPSSPCIKCSMIRLISHRFTMFSKQFGRLPEEDDELFFDETLSHPVRATRDEIRNQVLEASEAYGLNCFSLLSFLGLNLPSIYDERVL